MNSNSLFGKPPYKNHLRRLKNTEIPPVFGKRLAGMSASPGRYSDSWRMKYLLNFGKSWIAVTILHICGMMLQLRAQQMTPRNIQVGNDSPLLPSTLRAQAEPHLARHPLSPNILFATFQDGRHSDAGGGAYTCAYAVSFDSGNTWTRSWPTGLIQGIDAGLFERATDPVVAFDDNGDWLLCTLGLRGGATNTLGTVAVNRAAGGSVPPQFEAPRVILESNDPLLFPDKSWFTVDTFLTSPYRGNWVSTHTWFVTGVDGVSVLETPIRSMWSSDKGKTWSVPIVVGPLTAQGSIPLFLPDGTLVVGYWNYLALEQNRVVARPEIVRSQDGGRTFSQPITLKSVIPHNDTLARSGSALISLATDHQRGMVHLVCQGRINGIPRILYTRSLDQGRTWMEHIPINDTPNRASVFNPAIAVSPDGQHVTVMFYDKRLGDSSGSLVDVYLAESYDGGTTWRSNLRISDTSSDIRKAPMTGSGRMLGDYHGLVGSVGLTQPAVGIWIDTRNESPDPFVAQIPRKAGSSYDVWQRLRFFGTNVNTSTISRPTSDPDQDGIPNLMEYALGLEPDKPDHFPPTHKPKIAIDHAGRVTLMLDRLNSSSDLEWAWETSADLISWRKIDPESSQALLTTQAFLETWTVRFDNPSQSTAGSSVFFRFQVRVKM